MTLVTQIMMDEAGFFISEVPEDCKRQTDLLELERNLLTQYQYNIDTRTSKSNKLRRDADVAKKELVKTLQEKLKDASDKDNEKEPNALRVLLEIMTRNNTSAMKKMTKTLK